MAMNMSQRFNEFAEKVDALQFVFSGKNILHIICCIWNASYEPCDEKILGIYLVIIAGALLSVIGFFGCYGALRENRCFLGLVSFKFALILNFQLRLSWVALSLIGDKKGFHWLEMRSWSRSKKCLYDILLMSSWSFC